MIFLDCAATSFQKPAPVRRAVGEAMDSMSSPGRGAYRSAMLAADRLLDCRLALAELFHVPEPESVVFTSNATHALNIAVHSLVSPGDRVVISGYEHNAVTRPLFALGAEVDVAEAPLFEPAAMLEAFRRRIPGASAAVCTHVSNVFGYILPLEEIAALCREQGVPLVVDASQSAGVLPLDFAALGAAFVAMPGHKGLLGPQGTGVLLCGSAAEPLLCGGTGSESLSPGMPAFLPDRLEAGTHNIPGVAGLLEGVRWVAGRGTARILAHEQMLMRLFAENIVKSGRIRSHISPDARLQSGVVSLSVDGLDCEEAAARLGRRGAAVRAGLHCAPTAHRTVGTLESGTVRFSFSPFNTQNEVLRAASFLMDMAR